MEPGLVGQTCSHCTVCTCDTIMFSSNGLERLFSCCTCQVGFSLSTIVTLSVCFLVTNRFHFWKRLPKTKLMTTVFHYYSCTRKLCFCGSFKWHHQRSSCALSVNSSWHATCSLAGPVWDLTIPQRQEKGKDLQGCLPTANTALYFSLSFYEWPNPAVYRN